MKKLKAYHAYATERAVKTVAQTLIAFITASSALSIVDLDFGQALGVAGLAGVMSLLTSVLTYDKESNKEG
jgi:hypothetical protein